MPLLRIFTFILKSEMLRMIRFILLAIGILSYGNVYAGSQLSEFELIKKFQEVVTPNIIIPPDVEQYYSARLQESFTKKDINFDANQYVVLVDRNPNIQVVLIFFGRNSSGWKLIGASLTSTGLAGQFDHFLTPLGVFSHSLDNPDFRAEGTKNQFGFRGYGSKGMRVYDFGWIEQHRGWGNGEKMLMRLQMHSTDPELAENLLGNARSKGCIRIPASLNEFIDRYGLLDADYDAAMQRGVHFWLMRSDREPVNNSGRYLVVIESGADKKPAWMKAQKQ